MHFYYYPAFFSPRNAGQSRFPGTRQPPPFAGPRSPAIAARVPRFSRTGTAIAPCLCGLAID